MTGGNRVQQFPHRTVRRDARDSGRIANLGKWLVIASLLGLLALALWVAYQEWQLVADVSLPGWAWALMGLGVLLTILVGAGLMALMFYSSRMGYDEASHQNELEKNRRW